MTLCIGPIDKTIVFSGKFHGCPELATQEKIASRAGTKISLLVMPQSGGIWVNVSYR